MREGFVYLHRRLMASDIWTATDQTLRLMITCLFMANWQDQQWFNKSTHKSQLIPRGSFVTTFKTLEMASRLSSQSVRTALLNLSNMQFLTRTVTGRVTQITIIKYNDYQEIPTRKVTHRGTNEQHMPNTSSTQLEVIQEVKERKEGESPPVFSLSEFEEYWSGKDEHERYAAQVAIGLKAYKLPFRTEEDIYNRIMEGAHGNVRGKSIDQQAFERFRKMGLTKAGEGIGEALARIRGVPKIQPETGQR
jgi:hypothetical protein